MLLFHGTTLARALRILRVGPDPNYLEPGGPVRAENFSVCLPFGPFETTKRPEDYAWRKARAAAREGRDEGGAAILLVDVPDELVALAVDEQWLPLSQGFVQFDRGAGLEELRASWAELPRRVIPFSDPNHGNE